MRLTYDAAKRLRTLKERGLDFKDAPKLFSGVVYENEDDRFDYGEVRIITVGWLDGQMVVVVWTWRGRSRRIISMRKCNDREREWYGPYLG